MPSLSFPLRRKTVEKKAVPADLVPWAPRAAWDGFFAIAILDGKSAPMWVKAHLFHRSCPAGAYPLSMIEGLESSEMMIACGYQDRIEICRRRLDTSGIGSQADPLWVELPGRFVFSGKAPEYGMSFLCSQEGVEAHFHFDAEWPIWWSDWGRRLRYVGQHSGVTVDLQRDGKRFEARGMGVVEHVCGGAPRYDFRKAARIHYHWDVLRFEGEGRGSAAGLSLGRGGRTVIRLRAGLKLPGGTPEPADGLCVNYLRLSDQDGRIAVPERWAGQMKTRGGELVYEAARTTPVAELIPGGGMMGFVFSGEFKPKRGPALPLKGTGFSEYGDFSGALLKLAGSTSR